MAHRETLIAVAAALVLIGGPLLLGLAGYFYSTRRPAPPGDHSREYRNWKATLASTLLYTLAFNLTFFIQELFLVVPKALTPGLYPTLFHNNHRWQGDNPLASLFQGTGALAIFLSAIACSLLLRRSPQRSVALRLFLIWMAYNGFLQSLPQVIVGALEPRNDVGMAMDYLQVGASVKTAAALVALAAIPLAALSLVRPLLSLAEFPGQLASAAARSRFVFQVATLPALAAIPLIIPFRVPRNWVEVALVPVVVTLIGVGWLQAAAWRTHDSAPRGGTLTGKALAELLGVLVLVLLVFQLVLRPGVRFY